MSHTSYPHITTCLCVYCGETKPIVFMSSNEFENFVDSQGYIQWACDECEAAMSHVQNAADELGEEESEDCDHCPLKPICPKEQEAQLAVAVFAMAHIAAYTFVEYIN